MLYITKPINGKLITARTITPILKSAVELFPLKHSPTLNKSW